MFDFSQDGQGIVIIRTVGFWTPAVASAYRTELIKWMAKARSDRGYTLSLVDSRENVVQPPEVMAILSDVETLTVPGDRDRSALIMPSSLTKMQAQRVMHSPKAKAFLSIDAARTWLLAYT